MQTDAIKVLLLPNNRGWAFDFSAQQIAVHIGSAFEVEIAYIRERPAIDVNRHDIIFDFFWGDEYYLNFNIDPKRLIKNVSSHRWQDDPRYGPCEPAEFVNRYLSDAASVSCTSLKLFNTIRDLRPYVYYAPNGYNPGAFFKKQDRNGPLVIGWAGAPDDEVKGYHDIIKPACEKRFELRVAGGNLSHADMNCFYNEVDVLAIASKHEGEPLTLIESMAAGCFPVCTDVGIVPELVLNGVNGLIVKRSAQEFIRAFNWCASNVDFIRSAGASNAGQMVRRRTWETCIPRFRRLFWETWKRAAV